MNDNNQPSMVGLLLVIAVLGVLFVYPALSGGCAPNGWQIGAGPFNMRLKPVPPAPVITPPKTRCLVFSASWCSPCTKMKRNIAGMSRNGWRVGSLPTDDIEIIDVDGRDERISKFNPKSLPTLVIVDSSGKEVSRKSGEMSAAELAAWIQSTR